MKHCFDFQPEFYDAILNGTKTSTIRRRRKVMPVVGDTITLLTRRRIKGERVRKMGERRITSIDTMKFVEDEKLGIIPFINCSDTGGEYYYAPDLADVWAENDGFANYEEMLAWFQSRYPKTLTEGLFYLISWFGGEHEEPDVV